MTHQAVKPATNPLPAITLDAMPRVAEDPRWLERVARGTFCLMWLVPLDALARLLFPVLLLTLQLEFRDGPAVFWWRLTFAGTAAVFAVCGGYLLSLRNPADREADPPNSFRPLLWLAVLAWAGGEFCCVYPAVTHRFVTWDDALGLAMTVRQATELIAFGAICMLLRRLVRLTRRTLGPVRATTVRGPVLIFAFFFAVAALADSWATAAVFHRQSLPGPLRHPPGLLAPANLAVLAFVPLVVVAMYLSPLFFHLGHTFRRRGQAARELGAVPVGATGFTVMPQGAPHVAPRIPAAAE